MDMTAEDYREGFRNGTLAFCMPAAHDEISSDFLEEFSARILRRDWRDVSASSGSRAPSVIGDDETEDELVAEIQFTYGVDVSDLPGLPLWDVIRRCERYRDRATGVRSRLSKR
jgi:hypothetical protein